MKFQRTYLPPPPPLPDPFVQEAVYSIEARINFQLIVNAGKGIVKTERAIVDDGESSSWLPTSVRDSSSVFCDIDRDIRLFLCECFFAHGVKRKG